MRKVQRAVVQLLVVLGHFGGIASASPVMTDSGAIQGVREPGLEIYKGIRFADSPAGDQRWREPVPVTPWNGVHQAIAFAPACMQKGVSMPGEAPVAVSEDCLFLNIWKPLRRARTGLPVLVWIHGGGYSNGAASMPLYRGDRLARRGILVVTIAYRLGALGFLAHPELTRESAHGSSGNYGLMDQIAALEWIQKNIAAFGGDPQRVTIAGQSAGAMSVSALMASPRANGLFQRAIGQSGGIFEPVQLAPNYLLANAEREGAAYAASLGATSLKALRQLPAAALLGDGANVVTHPVIEPYLLPLAPYDTFARGRQNDVPLLLGSNAEEARALVDVAAVKAANFNTDLERSLGSFAAELAGAYPHATDEQARQARLDLERDLRFGWDMWAWARLQAKTGKHPVYYYTFTERPPFPAGSLYAGWGASHFAELWYMFDHLDQASWKWKKTDRKLADEMAQYWANFATSGDPNGRELPAWPAFTATDQQVRYLGGAGSIGAVVNFDRLRVFDAVYSRLRTEPSGMENSQR